VAGRHYAPDLAQTSSTLVFGPTVYINESKSLSSSWEVLNKTTRRRRIAVPVRYASHLVTQLGSLIDRYRPIWGLVQLPAMGPLPADSGPWGRLCLPVEIIRLEV
jgi:hypothetical protein